MLKLSILALGLVLTINQAFAAPSLVWTYEKKDGIHTPESVYFDEGTDSFYVANIAGDGITKDGVGWISKISRDGKKLQSKWLEGLNAPKGMRSKDGQLWVADIDVLVSIDLKTAKILNRYPAPGAQFLNDVAVGDDGKVFVSDTISGRIYSLRNGKMETFMEGPTLEGPNGLLLEGNTLYVVAWGQDTKPDWSSKAPGRLYQIDLKTKKQKFITPSPLGNLDGLERSPKGGFLVTDWVAGKVFQVSEDGRSEILLQDIKGAADLGIDSKNRILVVPSMSGDRVNAYLL